MPTFQHYVLGFLFCDDGKEIALVHKKRPAWQVGKLNGIGGKVEANETPADAMYREASEEAGFHGGDWDHFGTLCFASGRVDLFRYELITRVPIHSRTDEPVAWYLIKDLAQHPVVFNLNWLVPMALDRDVGLALIKDESVI